MYKDADIVPALAADVEPIAKCLCASIKHVAVLGYYPHNLFSNESGEVQLKYEDPKISRQFRIDCEDRLVRAYGCKTYTFETVAELKRAILHMIDDIVQC